MVGRLMHSDRIPSLECSSWEAEHIRDPGAGDRTLHTRIYMGLPKV